MQNINARLIRTQIIMQEEDIHVIQVHVHQVGLINNKKEQF